MHREDQKARSARINIVHFGPCASSACILSKPRERNISRRLSRKTRFFKRYHTTRLVLTNDLSHTGLLFLSFSHPSADSREYAPRPSRSRSNRSDTLSNDVPERATLTSEQIRTRRSRMRRVFAAFREYSTRDEIRIARICL